MNRVCVVAWPSDLFRCSKSWCVVCVLVLVMVVCALCLLCSFVCACLMTGSLVVFIVVFSVDVVLGVVML